jgi:hypothetical protein
VFDAGIVMAHTGGTVSLTVNEQQLEATLSQYVVPLPIAATVHE